MAVDNVNHLDIEADEEEQADGHIITTTTTSPSSASASASLSSLNDQHNDDHDAWPSSAEKQLTPPSTPTSSKYEENDDDASDDLKYDDSSSTKEAAAQLLVSTSADDGTKNSNAIDNISPSKPEVISDVGPPIPYANINAEKKHVTTVSIEQTDENYGPEPPAYMIAPTLANDHFAKKRGLIEYAAVRIDVDDDVRDHDTDAGAESLVIRVDDNSIPVDVHVDDASTDDSVSHFLIPHAWRVTEVVTVNNDDVGMVIIATPTIPWWKNRRSQILVGTVFLLLAALSIALGIVITSKNKPSTTEQDASSSPTSETPPSSPSLLLQTPSSCNESHTNNSMVNFGYYQEWAQYRQMDCNPVSPQKIDVKSFGYTHLSYAYGGISSDGFIEPYDGAIE